MPFDDYSEEDDGPITARYRQDLDNFKKTFDNYLHDTLKIEYYECEIDPNVMRITIRGNEKESEIISYRSNLFDPQVVDKMQDVLHSVLKAEDVLVSLQKKGYHLYKNPRNDNSFFAYIEGEKFEIKLAIERLVECRVSFEKLTGKKLTLDFDHMDGHAFERFCADILVGNGFESVRVTQGSGDQGIDIIAFKDGIKYGIQCKCYSSDIGNKAVQEAFAGKTFYDCHVGIVLTNQHFTSHAIELAKKNGIVLWDRNKLLTMIKKANN
ncbi:MAG: restriction endonuclease [Ruminococcaceae bacterium]|nr:restriction endonuclease [Oscillospiraceae bacterium]